MLEIIRRWLLGYPFYRSVILNTTTDKTFRGVLWDRRGEYLVLRQAEMLVKGAKPASMDGELVIPRTNVDFLQVVEPTVPS